MKPLFLFFLLQGGKNVIKPEVGRMGYAMRDWLILMAVLIFASIIIAAGIVFVRKRHSHRHHHSHSKAPASPKTRHEHHGRRRRSREKRVMNPTLAETGGLPPARPEDQPPKF